ncbi:PREDICTED: uncharacterized protein LOC109235722 isoform X1 [Nicotiana attenuata]|uniref:uncharacterized protein LOC109235722 isoform X1 n=1 Tax=Nicotiana attenuata TaxID=49451 RepID=UPI000904C7FF|nr:PREDICTED: uncharacterized protein LOC109235722 isoform X1 [Nicotiana attenuata]XP_019257478.1 PREDICTED: uncharacterized protein LOC109235722 isoform X1 [Nicotiana attenuata]XP_019257479.1 PREDICTED: uncharacterized protein LOC109235722 isoform X1 [Nicotiana attenuata]
MDNTTASADELLKKFQELEADHAQLKQEMSKLMITYDHRSQQPPRCRAGGGFDGGAAAVWKSGSTYLSPLNSEGEGDNSNGDGHAAVKFTDRHYLNILQSMGQALYIFDINYRINYWNRSAERLFGYSAEEALGQDTIELLADAQHYGDAAYIIDLAVKMGESWTGQFPVKNKQGDGFLIIVTTSPFYDDEGTFVGVISVASNARDFQETGFASMEVRQLEPDARFRARTLASSKLGLDPQQPLQVTIASKISNLASKASDKVKSKIKTGDSSVLYEGGSGDSHYFSRAFSGAALSDHREHANSIGASTRLGDFHPSPVGLFSNLAKEEHSLGKHSSYSGDESEGKQGICKAITLKAEAWMARKSLPWPWKGNNRDVSETESTRLVRAWLNNNHENEINYSNSYNALKPDNQFIDTNWTTTNEASGSWSTSFNVNSTSSPSSCGSTSSSDVNKVDMDTDCLDYESLWEDVTIGEGTSNSFYSLNCQKQV